MSPAARCIGPKCKRPPVAHGLCSTHYRQHLRTGKLKPIALRRDEPTVQITIRVSASTYKALGDHPVARARDIVEVWVQRAGAKRTA